VHAPGFYRDHTRLVQSTAQDVLPPGSAAAAVCSVAFHNNLESGATHAGYLCLRMLDVLIQVSCRRRTVLAAIDGFCEGLLEVAAQAQDGVDHAAARRHQRAAHRVHLPLSGDDAACVAAAPRLSHLQPIRFARLLNLILFNKHKCWPLMVETAPCVDRGMDEGRSACMASFLKQWAASPGQ